MKNPQKLVSQIKKELKKERDLGYKKRSAGFFKEKINPIGVPAKETRRISREFFAQVKSLPKKEIFALCEALLNAGYQETSTIAFDWSFRLKSQFEKKDFAIFERWGKKYVSNWALCDDFCGHSLGFLLFEYPELLAKVKKWTDSKNRWARRAAAVTLIYGLRRGQFLQPAFWIAKKLLRDPDDLVQKGYGWMLKEASQVFEKEIFEFVLKHKKQMPRTALRYAIEKMPREKRARAMS